MIIVIIIEMHDAYTGCFRADAASPVAGHGRSRRQCFTLDTHTIYT